MSSKNMTGSSKDCEHQPRAERKAVQTTTDCTNCRSEQPSRTSESRRAEIAFRDWSKEPEADRPLQRHRAAHARVLAEWMTEHGISKSRFADMLGIDEKAVRKMLKMEKTIPSEVSSCMPKSLRQDYLNRLVELDGGSAPGLSHLISQLDHQGLVDAMRCITDRLYGGSK